MDLLVLHAGAWPGYLAGHLFPQARLVPWRAQLSSREVVAAVQRHAASSPDGAPALWFHLDLSDTRRTPRGRPWLRRWLAAQAIPGLNEGADDLSRRRLQARLRALGLRGVALEPGCGGDVRVIVKTDPNHGGQAELRLAPADRACLGIGFEGAWLGRARDYRVLPLRDVPPEVLAHPDYAVERYVANAAGRFFRAYVSGTSVVVVKAHGEGEIMAIRGDARDENWAFRLDDPDAPADRATAPGLARAVRTLVQAHGLHFCAIDFVQDDEGALYAIDLNTTPWGGKAPLDEEIARFLREGFVEGVLRRRERLRRAAPPRTEAPPQGVTGHA